tara:strand:- start:2881 stop:3507 length:627 start_codon:yes stop_codon:yes gene_type:complete
MATVAGPYGLKAVNHIGGTPYAGSTRLLPITTAAVANATSIFNGQVVNLTAGGTVIVNPNDGDSGGAGGTAAAFGAGVVGVFVGCTYSDPVTGVLTFNQYWPGNAATDALAYVVDDPNALFQIQAAGPIVQAELGENFHFQAPQTGTAISGNSTTAACIAADFAVTAGFGFRLVDFVDGPTSTVGDAFTDLICKFNADIHSYTNSTGI